MPEKARLEVICPDERRTIPIDENGAGKASLADVLRKHSLPLNTRCGQRGLCDGCEVLLNDGELVHRDTGKAVRAGAEPVMVRACEHAVRRGATGMVTIEVPGRSMLCHEPQVLTDFRINVPWGAEPLEGDAAGRLGVAVDIGTTTVVVLVADRRSGQILARGADFNRQIHHGDDVLTRINLCLTDPTMLATLQQAVVAQTIRPLLTKALAQLNASEAELGCITLAGNTTMLHLLTGVDPSSMGVAPFTPVFVEHRRMAGDALGLTDAPVPVHLLPSAAAYVGADITAGVLVTGLAYDPGPAMLVDVGTNGEIVLKTGDQMFGCATAAGPAFEGSGLASGMRASSGAISHLTIDDHAPALRTETIGNAKPIGMCGSAYLDLLAEGARSGLMNHIGRFDKLSAERLGIKFTQGDGCGTRIQLARGIGNRHVLVTETDVANLLKAKAAIAAGIQVLLQRAELTPAHVKTLYLAGGFGMHMNIPNAIAAGMLPGFRPEQIQVVGNTSLGGAYVSLLDQGVLQEMTSIADRMQIIELNQDPNFEMHYIDALTL